MYDESDFNFKIHAQICKNTGFNEIGTPRIVLEPTPWLEPAIISCIEIKPSVPVKIKSAHTKH